MRIKSISYDGKADVYNMEVDETHSFIINGGVVSHNCADETRYFCMARPIKPRTRIVDDGYGQTPQAMFLDIPKEDIVARRPRMQRMEVIRSGKEE